MGKDSAIEWCDHTFNVREGCQKVSPACEFCYAWQRDERWHGGANWGPEGERKEMSTAYWKQPLKWNRDAQKTGEKRLVFCSSLADVFELPPREELRADYEKQLRDLGALIRATPNLIYLLLTKRPENWQWAFELMGFFCGKAFSEGYTRWVPPPNVFPMTTAETQEYANKRIPQLLDIPSALGHGVSLEPLLGPLDVSPWLDPFALAPRLQWAITGGESSPKARPSHPDWFRSLRDQCAAAGVPFFMKQITEHGRKVPIENWPADLRVREFPSCLKA